MSTAMEATAINLCYAEEEWAKLRRPGAVGFVQKRLSSLSKSLGDKSFLDGRSLYCRRPDDGSACRSLCVFTKRSVMWRRRPFDG
jgi:hypothetical protein